MKSLLDCHMLPYFVLQKTLIAAAFFLHENIYFTEHFLRGFLLPAAHWHSPLEDSGCVSVLTLFCFWFSFDLFMVEVSPVP